MRLDVIVGRAVPTQLAVAAELTVPAELMRLDVLVLVVALVRHFEVPPLDFREPLAEETPTRRESREKSSLPFPKSSNSAIVWSSGRSEGTSLSLRPPCAASSGARAS